MKARLYFRGHIDLDVGDEPGSVFLPPIDAAIEQARLYLGRQAALQAAEVHLTPVEDWTPTCRVCGCTDDVSCEGGCSWVGPDLCSACEDRRQRV